MKTILDVEPDSREASALAAVLANEFHLVHCAENHQAADHVSSEKPAVVLVDLSLPLESGLRLISSISGGNSALPVIAMSRNVDPQTVVSAIRHGASDFLSKPLNLEDVRAAIHRAIVPPSPGPFIGSSAAILRVTDTLRKYARHEYPVLILGESGTGKELAARAIHALSPRLAMPFAPRNCAAFPEELIESELFGSSRGAFTGAIERPGAFELADGGTLFLDEIGEACAAIQAKLLRVLETGELWRLGDRHMRKADVRLVSATSRNLKEAADRGLFRHDLLYRIDTLVLEIPPLRDRREDVPELAAFFARNAAGSRKRFSAFALERMVDEQWPGNIRQLKNVVHRAIVLSGEREEIGEEFVVVY